MGFYCLDESGYFYAKKSIVKVSKKPAGVKRYLIYKDVTKPTLISIQTKYFDIQNGEILEVVTENLERIFFVYINGKFERKHFAPVHILEGEHELSKHLGLLGLARVKHYDEIPL